MIDVESMIRASRAAWVPRFLAGNCNSGVLNHYLTNLKISIKVLIEGGMTDQKAFPEAVCLPHFYIDCIMSFNLCKDKLDTSSSWLQY